MKTEKSPDAKRIRLAVYILKPPLAMFAYYNINTGDGLRVNATKCNEKVRLAGKSIKELPNRPVLTIIKTLENS
jgi:hypothetical protein